MLNPSRMTPRARLQAVLKRQTPDRIPWAPLMEDSYIQGEPHYWEMLTAEEKNLLQRTYRYPSVIPLPTDLGFADPVIWRMTSDLGADVIGFAPTVQQANMQVEMLARQEDDQTILDFHTPWGNLQEIVVSAGTAETVYKSRFAIAERDDYKIVSKIIEHRQHIACPEKFAKQEERVGDRGLCFVRGADQPLVSLFRLRDPAQLVFDLVDEPDRMQALLDLIHLRNLEWYSQIAEQPGQAVWTGMAFFTTQIISPALFRKFALPYLAEYTRILHNAGKVLLCHMCGHIRRLLPLLQEAGIDGIECMAIPPIGDTTLDEYWKVMGPQAILMAGINAVYIRQASQTEVQIYTRDVLARNKNHHFVLRTADEIPFGTPWENLLAVSQVVQGSSNYEFA